METIAQEKADTFPRNLASFTDLSLFEQAPDALVIHDANTGIILNINQKARELYAYTFGNIRKKSVDTLYSVEPPYTPEELFQYFLRAKNGEPQLFEWKCRNANNKDRWVEISLKALTFENQNIILSTARDISYRKDAEQNRLLQYNRLTLLQQSTLSLLQKTELSELLPSVAKHAVKLLSAAHSFIYLINASNSALDLALATEEFPVYPTTDLGDGFAGKVWKSNQPLIESTNIKQNIRAVGSMGNTTLVGVPLNYGDLFVGVIGICFSEADYNFDNDALLLLNSFAELAAVAINNALCNIHSRPKPFKQNKETYYHKLFSNLNDFVCLAELTTEGKLGHILDVTDITCRIFGYSREEFLTLSPIDLIPLEQRGNVVQEIQNIWEKDIELIETSYVGKSGILVPVEVHAKLMYLDATPCVIISAHDISKRKLTEKSLTRLHRLDLISSMAAGLGHEIRNPLTTVRGFLQMLANKEDCHHYSNYFELMLKELDRANSIITQFLSLAKNKTTELYSGKLNDVINMVLPLLEAGALLYDKTIKTDLSEIPDIQLNEKEIRQLILHFVRNGLEAMPPGSSLLIKTFCRGKKVVLTVHDQGQGIAPGIADQIGTPFFTTKEYGVGLGLAVCYSIAARHNADITFNTTATGTTFEVSFNQAT
ncbi:MAG: signal transduction histidine kinase, nitrogen specific, NtrB [Firmicutes bacterium]|nr:signal transduction histidine kinase, nitrogen specific, NtrB [Bacillota bacterium]